MFEKSLYDLIRGLRNHKGTESEYIQNSLKECRVEIKSQDMDKKAIALLKLIYLEMFGYDMSWASFHVLEVMSSQKYIQKRVGYLGAVQSFRPDTEVLMLATNLLKKDVVSPLVPVMSLPLITIPHIISPSLALSLLSDLLPRLTHSHPAVRKKTVVNLYRLSLVYPEAFRIAWPKIKERLMDEEEDSCVTAAVINVVCELGWRRPQDFLPLAPRLFDLLVDGGNNWMAIKIIKLFASLTPLEPRLVRKLLRPLTNIIQTTSAMSLLYECINGVIQGGILEGSEGVREGEVIANLCVDKLRGMLVLEGDPNLKYVALLAFNRIAITHPTLVSSQQDIIMDSLDDNDISIRLQTLDLVSRIVTSETLQPVVNRLITQLQTSPVSESPTFDLPPVTEVMLSADNEGQDPEEPLESSNRNQESIPALPNHYRIEVLHRILDICSGDTYSSILDFDWYVEVLVQLVKLVPPSGLEGTDGRAAGHSRDEFGQNHDVSGRIGSELRNVAVRVKTVRGETVRAAESLILIDHRSTLFSTTNTAGTGILEPVAWIVGEFSEYLNFPEQTLSSLIHTSNSTLPSKILSSYLQAIPKLFVRLTSHRYDWNSARQTEISLLLARITDFLETLSSHPDLDVQERAIEFLELLRLTSEAVSAGDIEDGEMPLLVSSAIPSLFSGLELNPVAAGAQKKVPIPDDLDLDKPLNDRLPYILKESDAGWFGSLDEDEFHRFYYVPEPNAFGKPAPRETLAPGVVTSTSYQNVPDSSLDPAEIARRRAERRERNKDDPFYIAAEGGSSGTSTPFHQVLRGNGEELDIDSIPIIDLALEGDTKLQPGVPQKKKKARKPKKVEIIADENIDVIESSSPDKSAAPLAKSTKTKKSLLEVDSSGLGHISLEDEDSGGSGRGGIEDFARKQAEEQEMAKAMADIERLRLEMQRASERIHAAEDVPPEGTLVKRKKKKKKAETSEPKTRTKKGKESSVATETAPNVPSEQPEPGTGEVVKKKKKRKVPKKAVKEEQTEATGNEAS